MSYQESNSEAAKVARDMFLKRIERGRASGARIIQKIMEEVPEDRIAKGTALAFDGDILDRLPGEYQGIRVGMPDPRTGFQGEMGTHPWALQQMCSRAGIPWSYAQKLRESEIAAWGTPLLAHNLSEMYKRSQSRFLVRSYDNTIRGFLSDRYRRLDSRPLIESFAKACQETGAVAIEGYGTDTKVGLTAMLPKIYEPIAGDPISFGVHWENSDYGNGKHTIHGFIDRAWCSNGMIMSVGFAQVHLGRRLEDSLFLSNRTHQLDTMTTASAVEDVVKSTLSDKMVQAFCETVVNAHEKKVDVKKALQSLSKQLSKGEVENVQEIYNTADVELMPPGNSLWRLSNAISWVAGNQTEDEERQLELLKLAGTVLTMKAPAAA